MKHIRHLFTALLSLCTTVAIAHDFEVDGICYNITGATDRTVEVTSGKYTGSVVVPESVDYDGSVYSVTAIGDYALAYCNSLKNVTSLIPAENLFAIKENVFYNVDRKTCILYVPKGARRVYESTSGWNYFINVIDPEEPTAICDIPDAGTGAGTVYDLNGRAVKNPTNGIHIINGKKVMVK